MEKFQALFRGRISNEIGWKLDGNPNPRHRNGPGIILQTEWLAFSAFSCGDLSHFENWLPLVPTGLTAI
jgi:hypothetical protein